MDVLREGHRRYEQHRHGRPAEEPGARQGTPGAGPAGERDREERADPELPDAGGGGEERREGVGVRGPDRPRERGGDENAEHRGHGPPARSVHDERQQDEEQRPDDVELLLDRQGPVVLHRRGAHVRGEVVHLAAREHPVDDVRRCGRDVDGDVPPSQAGDDDERHGGRDDEHEDRGGEEPADPAADEPQPGDGSGGLELDDEESGDEEARDDEEDVDTDEATAQREPGVVGEDGEDRDGAKPLDVRPEPRSGGAFPSPTALGPRPGAGARHLRRSGDPLGDGRGVSRLHAAWRRARRAPRRAPGP